MARGPGIYPYAVPSTFLRPGDQPACRAEGVDPEWFFPRRIGGAAVERKPLAKARAICRTCPLTERCADWAASNFMRFGVWGGLTAKQLDQRRRCMTGRCHHPTCWEEAA